MTQMHTRPKNPCTTRAAPSRTLAFMQRQGTQVTAPMHSTQHHASTARHALHTCFRHSRLHTTATPRHIGACYMVCWCGGYLCEEGQELTHTTSSRAIAHLCTQVHKLQPCTCPHTTGKWHVSEQPCVHLRWCLPSHGTTMAGVHTHKKNSVIASVLLLMQRTEPVELTIWELPHTP